MRALSIKQPWLHAITDLGKRVENRTWPPVASSYDTRIALHASKSYDEDGHRAIEEITGRPLVGAFVHGAILATAVIVGWVAYDDSGEACCRYGEHAPYFEDPWFFGPWGWILDDIRKLSKPIPCRGMLGLWRVPDELLKRIEEED